MSDIRKFVRELSKHSVDNPLKLRAGTVVAKTTNTYTITLSGSLVEIPEVSSLSNVAHAPNDKVWLLKDGPDLIILGSEYSGG